MEEPKRRKLLGPLEIIMLVFGLGILAFIGFQRGGYKVMERTESVTILEKPNGPQKKKARKYRSRGGEESVEILLQEMAEQLSDENQPIITTSRKKKAPRLSKDEKKFYDKVQKKATLSEKLESAKDWYRILSASQKTYSKVREIVGEAARTPEERVNTSNVDKQLKSKKSQSDFYKKLSENFKIDPADIEAFGRQGSQALSDWAEFVQENAKK